MSPLDLLSLIKAQKSELSNAHVFGYPVYVLDPKLQGHSSLPKMTPRSRQGIFVCFSPRHSSSVPLVLSLQTLSITPQFHIVFDDWFTTVSSSTIDDPLNPVWLSLFSDGYFQYSFDENDDVELDTSWKINELSFDTPPLPIQREIKSTNTNKHIITSTDTEKHIITSKDTENTSTDIDHHHIQIDPPSMPSFDSGPPPSPDNAAPFVAPIPDSETLPLNNLTISTSIPLQQQPTESTPL
jgi:hypothetical protein